MGRSLVGNLSLNQGSLYSRVMSMQRRVPRIGFLLGLLSLALVALGCGSGDSTSRSSSLSESAGGAELSAQFRTSDKHSLAYYAATYGKEASAEEREIVSDVVVKNLTAREDADFKAQCETLNKHGIAEVPGAKNHEDCPGALQKYAEPLPKTKAYRKNPLAGPVTAVRVKGEKAFALFHGTDGKDLALPLEKEDGEWRVSAVFVTEL